MSSKGNEFREFKRGFLTEDVGLGARCFLMIIDCRESVEDSLKESEMRTWLSERGFGSDFEKLAIERVLIMGPRFQLGFFKRGEGEDEGMGKGTEGRQGI